MKIGIFTFHCAHNFGAMLQAYALQHYLELQNHEVYVIDYRPEYLIKPYKRHSIRHWLSRNPIRMVKKILTEPFLLKKRETFWNKFECFINTKLRLYPYTANADYSEFDIIILGSDQIWNPKLTGDKFDKVFLGGALKLKKIAYAASMGYFKPNSKEKEILYIYLKELSEIFIREKGLNDILSPLMGQNLSVVCDPVFLLSKKEWEKECMVIHHRRPYVLCYNLLNSDECEIQAKCTAQKLGYDVIIITGSPILFRIGKQYRQTLSPLEFISYLEGASFIVTSSFHGTAFALIFQKEFYSVGLEHNSGRILSLLSLLHLEKRLLDKPMNEIVDAIDYASVTELLEKHIAESKDLLYNAITKN
jgi:hypothetical protein